MALFAWLPLFLLHLFSAILGMDLHYIPAFSNIEVLRWNQPICTSASPCHTYESRNYGVDQVQKVLNVREVRESIDIDELEPSTLDSPVIYEKLDAPEHSENARSRRHFSGRYLPYDPPPAILVTKVIDSPVTATITGRNCIGGVPSCGSTRVPIHMPPEQEQAPPRSYYSSVVQSLSLSDAIAGQNEFVEKYAKKKDAVVQQIIDEVSHKKDAVVQAVESMKQSIIDNLSLKKDAIVGAVTSAAEAKHEFVQGIFDKKKEKVQPIIDAVSEKKDKIIGMVADVAAVKYGYVKPVIDKVHEKKEQLVEAVSGAAAAKHEFIEGIVQEKKDKVQALKDKIAEAVEAKQEFIEGIVEKKKEKIQPVVDKVHEKEEQITAAVSDAIALKKEFVGDVVEKLQEKKDKIVEFVTNVTAPKIEFVEGIIEKKHEKLQEKKDKIVEFVTNATAPKIEFFQGIIEKKHEKLQEKKDKIVEFVTNATAPKKEFFENKHEHLQETKDKVVAAVFSAAAAKQEFVEDVVEKKKENLQQKKEEIAQAYASVVQATIDKKHEKIKDIKDSFSTLSSDKQAAIQKVINKTMHVIHEFEEAKEKAEQDLAQKKQEFIQSVADRKIAAIKHVSEKVQEYIGTASLVKPLIKSQINQMFNKNEEEIEERKADEGDDFVFVDEDGNEMQAEQTQGRTIELFKKFILKKKLDPTVDHNASTEATTVIEESAHPVVLTQEAESTIPEANSPTEKQEIVEVPVSSTTEKIVNVIEDHEVPAYGPTGIGLPEQTSNEVHAEQVISQASEASSSAHAHEEVEINVDTPTTVEEATEVNGTVDVEGKNAQVDLDEIVPKNVDVDEFIAHLLSKLVSDKDVAASSDEVLAKNANVEAAESIFPNEGVAVEAESAPVIVEKVVITNN